MKGHKVFNTWSAVANVFDQWKSLKLLLYAQCDKKLESLLRALTGVDNPLVEMHLTHSCVIFLEQTETSLLVKKAIIIVTELRPEHEDYLLSTIEINLYRSTLLYTVFMKPRIVRMSQPCSKRIPVQDRSFSWFSHILNEILRYTEIWK